MNPQYGVGGRRVYSVNVRRNRTAEETQRQIDRIYRNYNNGNYFNLNVAGLSNYSQQRLIRVAPSVWNALALTGRDEGPSGDLFRTRLLERRRISRR